MSVLSLIKTQQFATIKYLLVLEQSRAMFITRMKVLI